MVPRLLHHHWHRPRPSWHHSTPSRDCGIRSRHHCRPSRHCAAPSRHCATPSRHLGHTGTVLSMVFLHLNVPHCSAAPRFALSRDVMVHRHGTFVQITAVCYTTIIAPFYTINQQGCSTVVLPSYTVTVHCHGTVQHCHGTVLLHHRTMQTVIAFG